MQSTLWSLISGAHPRGRLVFAHWVEGVNPTFIARDNVAQHQRFTGQFVQVLLRHNHPFEALVCSEQFWDEVCSNFLHLQVVSENFVHRPHTQFGQQRQLTQCQTTVISNQPPDAVDVPSRARCSRTSAAGFVKAGCCGIVLEMPHPIPDCSL